MSRESEKALKAMNEFLEKNSTDDMSIEEMNGLLDDFMNEYNNNIPGKVTEKTAKTADDYLELAEETQDKTKADKYIRKAMELEPENLDVINASLDLGDDTPWEHYQKLIAAVSKGTELMEKKGLMTEENIGNFWGIFETRPYMRLRNRYMDFLLEAGMYKAAANECEELLRLSENDNLGIRYCLIHLYAFLENEEAALKLHKKYKDYDESMLLFPLSVLFFKLRNFEKAEEYLKRLVDVNKDTKRFFRALKKDKLDRYADEMSGYGYQPFTIQELIVDLIENDFLFRTVPLYIEWAYEKTRNM